MTKPNDPSSDPEESPPNPALLERLMAKVETLPFRYAPFFDRLAELFDVPAREIEAVLDRARDERMWRPTLFLGVRRLALATGPRLRGADAYLLRLSPGVRFPRHRHRGSETVFVLEGSYLDTSGRRVGPGERQDMAVGSEHGLLVGKEGPCVAAVVTRGVDFTGPLLGKVTELVGWLRGSSASSDALDEPGDAEQNDRRADDRDHALEERRMPPNRRDRR